MADVFVTNTSGGSTIAGAPSDRLVVTYTISDEEDAVHMIGFAGSLAAGYSGLLDGPGSNDISFDGFGSFSYTSTGDVVDGVAGGDGNDTFATGAGDDVINSRGGIDVVDGGNGKDAWSADMSFATEDIVIDLNGASNFLGTGSVVNVEGFFALSTGSGNDHLTSTSALVVEWIDTGAGNDTIALQPEAQKTVEGGSGSDRLVLTYAAGNVILNAPSGNLADGYSGYVEGLDDVGFSGIESFTYTNTGFGIDNITTGDGNDVFATGASADIVNARGGNDSIKGGNGKDTLNGGAGTDTADYSDKTTAVVATLNGATNATVTVGGVAEDTIRSIENVLGGTAADTLTGDALANHLDGGLGADAMTGGAGDDNYVVDNAGDTTVEAAGGGADMAQSSLSHTLAANVENLVLTGAATINGTGNTSVNAITGNSAANTLSGLAGNDTLTGLGGNDRLDGGANADAMSGGNGNDTYVVDNAGDTASEASGSGTDLVQSAVTFTLGTGVENLALTGTAAINGTGNTSVNAITGNSAANTLSGLAGNDTLTGLGGNDRLDGGANADAMSGGNGNDTYVVDNAGDTASEASGSGTDLVQSAVTFTLGTGVENLALTGTAAINGTGNTSVNAITGNSAANTLSGLAGNDTLTGLGGNDRLDGGANADAMSGGNGNDTYVVDNAGDTVSEASGSGIDTVQSAVSFTLATGIEALVLSGAAAINGAGNSSANTLSGNSAANRLDGNGANDTLTGFGGADVFVFDDGDGADTVTDFANGSDKFDVSAVAAVNNFSDLTVIDNGATVTVNYGTGSFTIGNVGNPAVIDASDFVF